MYYCPINCGLNPEDTTSAILFDLDPEKAMIIQKVYLNTLADGLHKNYGAHHFLVSSVVKIHYPTPERVRKGLVLSRR